MNLSNIIIGLLILSFGQLGFAGEGGQHGVTVFSLKWPIINFTVLMAFLVIKLKNPIKEMFDKNAVTIKETYNFAEGKDKEAEIKLKMYKEKLEHFNLEEKKMKREIDKELKLFEENKNKEINDLVKRLEKDAENKVSYEKRLMIDNLNHDFLDAVILQVKNKIGQDQDYQAKATKNLLAEI
jgi:F-type H+-transporting ATPase subunit b